LVVNNSIYTIAYNFKSHYHEKKSIERNLFDFMKIDGITKSDIQELAIEAGFMKRKPKKIDPFEYLTIMCILSVADSPSFNNIAAKLSSCYGISASKQAFSKRTKKECVEFFQSVLALIIKTKLCRTKITGSPLLEGYKRVLVQDSTIIRLPPSLYDVFSGVKNATATVCNARIQGVFDLVSGKFVEFSIDPYSKNDLLAAPELVLCKDDLVLRDRGYFIMDEVQRHLDVNAHCIYRYKTGTTLLNPATGEKINILELLTKMETLDMEVCLNNGPRTKVRVIAVPVSQEIASQRRAKAKRDACGHNPSKDVLDLMGWTIFLTTIPKESASFQQIYKTYSLRWRIEIIFKAWKSHVEFANCHDVSESQLRTMLIARLIMIVIYVHCVYSPSLIKIRKEHERDLSLLKLFGFLTQNLDFLVIMIAFALDLPNDSVENEIAKTNLVRYCSHDIRSRTNFIQQLMNETELS
jgi:hypothetical protein